MYNGNPKLRGFGQQVATTPEQINEYIRCKEDILYFAENYFYIIEARGKMKIELRDYQRKMLKAFMNPTKGRRHNVVLSARQSGKTTTASIFLLHYALFHDNKTIAVMANKEKTSMEILLRIKTAIQELPIWFQQGIDENYGGWQKGSIGFENGIRLVGGSTASNALRTYSISLLYLDEFAFVPDNIAEDFMRSVYPTISSFPDSQIIIVSTPNGMNHYHAIWKNAIQGSNSYMPIQVKWQDVPVFANTPNWKEQTIADIGPVAFAVEYGGQFLGSRNTLIDPEHIERMVFKHNPTLAMSGGLLVYEEPIKNQFYILGVDSAKGTGKDYSVIQVLKVNSEHDFEQVAIYRNNTIEANDFAQVVISVSKYFNGAYMMVENNDVGGEVASSIFYEYEYDRIVLYDKKGIGIRSTKKSKLAANLLLKRYIENGWLEIFDRETIREVSRYEEIAPNRFACPRGSHDDCVTSLIWALYFTTSEWWDGKTGEIKVIKKEFQVDDENEKYKEPVMFFGDGESVNDPDEEWEEKPVDPMRFL